MITLRSLLCRLNLHVDAGPPVYTVKDGHTVIAQGCCYCDWTSPGMVIPSKNTLRVGRGVAEKGCQR